MSERFSPLLRREQLVDEASGLLDEDPDRLALRDVASADEPIWR